MLTLEKNATNGIHPKIHYSVELSQIFEEV